MRRAAAGGRQARAGLQARAQRLHQVDHTGALRRLGSFRRGDLPPADLLRDPLLDVVVVAGRIKLLVGGDAVDQPCGEPQFALADLGRGNSMSPKSRTSSLTAAAATPGGARRPAADQMMFAVAAQRPIAVRPDLRIASDNNAYGLAAALVRGEASGALVVDRVDRFLRDELRDLDGAARHLLQGLQFFVGEGDEAVLLDS